MSLKHILLPLNGEADGKGVALAALRAAQQLGAHVSAGYEDALGPLYAPSIGFIPAGPVLGDFYDQMQKLRAERMKAARDHFDDAVAATRVPIVSEVACSRGSAMWLEGPDDSALSQRGLVVDLAVAASPGKSMSPGPWGVVEALLFGAVAPVLLIPGGAEAVDFRRPLIAWNGSREAVRALQSLVQLLPSDARATLVQVGKLAPGRTAAAAAIDYLGWHCVAADLVLLDGKDNEAPAIVQGKAAELQSSLLVMGAYTHGRTRQFLLGGLTSFMLGHSPLPTLMCH